MKVTIPLNLYAILESGGYLPHHAQRGFIRNVKKGRFHAYIENDVLDLHFDKFHRGYHSAGNSTRVWPELKKLGFNKSHIVIDETI